MMQLIADGDAFTGSNIWADATGKMKVEVKLVAADNTVTTYMLNAGEDWPTGITATNYKDMPSKVAGGTYYAKS